MKLSGVAAIVTGGGSGLGRATAEALAARGALVTVFDLNPAAAEEAAKAVRGLAVVGDVADDASAGAALAKAAAAHGPARVLVNCAGIGVAKRVVGRDGPHPLADFERVIRVNLIGSFNMIRLASGGDGQARADRRRARGRHFDRLGRGLRRPDRPGGLFGLQGRRGGDDAADRARTGADRRPGERDRARHLHDADAVRAAAGGAGFARRLGAVPRRGSASPPNTPRSPCISSRTAISTARRSASTARFAWRQNSAHQARARSKRGRKRCRGQGRDVSPARSRSSPARPPASAGRRRRCSMPRAPRSPRPTATKRACKTLGPDADLILAQDVTDEARWRAVVDAVLAALRPPRHPRQQRRHRHPRQYRDGDARRLAQGQRGQCRGHVSWLPRSGAGDEGERRRLDRQSLVGRRHHRRRALRRPIARARARCAC